MNFQTHMATLGADLAWVECYLKFVESAPSPVKRSHRHHILPRAMFPEFESFQAHSWNCKRLSPSDHFVAHYYLYRALPQHPAAYLSFLKMASAKGLSILAKNGYDESLVREMSLEYEHIRSGAVSLEGWAHVYKGDKHTVIPIKEIGHHLADGWTKEAPPRQWVFKGDESYRVLSEKVPGYLAEGFQLGRSNFHTKESKRMIGESSVRYHEQEVAKGNGAYSYLPRGDNHPRHISGCPPEVADKISKALTGVPKPPEHPIHQGISKGKHWSWPEEAKQSRSDSMKGITPTNGLTMAGKTHSENTKEQMSKSHEEFYANNLEGVKALDAARPRGESHVFYGKERDAVARAKISASLVGRKQSEATRLKRAESLRAYHLSRTARESSIRRKERQR